MIMKMQDLINMGHKVLWPAIIANKQYYYMRDHEGSVYWVKQLPDGSVELLD